MALILSIETSGANCSVALHHDGTIVGFVQVDFAQAHAARLAPLIDQVFKDASLSPRSLNAVAISAGPGSYTGLRIGTSTAKGICFSLAIPLIAVNTLDLLAYQGRKKVDDSNALLCPMIDARRMEVYCQVTTSDLLPVQPVEARIVDETSFQELLALHKMFFFGDGAAKCETVITHANSFFVAGVRAEASSLGVIATEKFRRQQFADLAGFVPFYLKEFVAKKAQPFF